MKPNMLIRSLNLNVISIRKLSNRNRSCKIAISYSNKAEMTQKSLIRGINSKMIVIVRYVMLAIRSRSN